MAEAAEFRDLADRFRDIQRSHDPREHLEALYVKESRFCLAQQAAWKAHKYALSGKDDLAFEHGHEAAHQAGLILQGSTRFQGYRVTGGPEDETIRRSLHAQWTAFAVIGATAVGAVGSTDSVRNAWLNLLRRRSPYYSRMDGDTRIDGGKRFANYGGVINRLCRASWELCTVLESEATIESSHRNTAEAAFSKRASWLNSFKLTKTRLCTVTGVDKKTIQKILDGQRVGEPTLAKLVKASGTQSDFPSFSRADIPNS